MKHKHFFAKAFVLLQRQTIPKHSSISDLPRLRGETFNENAINTETYFNIGGHFECIDNFFMLYNLQNTRSYKITSQVSRTVAIIKNRFHASFHSKLLLSEIIGFSDNAFELYTKY